MAPRKSWVWKYSIPSEDGIFVTCNICDSISFNGSTSAIIKHLRGKHRKAFSDSSIQLDINSDQPSTSGSGLSHNINVANPWKKLVTPCTTKRQEEISQVLARMILINMMPISFCNSNGFKEFMAALEPGYQCPCPKSILKKLQIMYNEKRRIEEELSVTPDIALTNEGWSSRSQNSYISTTAHFIYEN